MRPSPSLARQRGVATIFVAMILLLLITVLVTAAYSISTTNLRAVRNLQVRQEGIAAANAAIEQVLPLKFWEESTPPTRTIEVNIDFDPDEDYQVTIPPPICLRATKASITTTSSVTLPGFSAISAWNTVWELDATAIDDTSGTRVRVRHGVRVLMSEAEKDDYCG